MKRIRNWFRRWMGIDNLVHDIDYLRKLIEGDYCIILDTEGATIENCCIENFETAILIKGKNSTIRDCYFKGKWKEDEHTDEEWETFRQASIYHKEERKKLRAEIKFKLDDISVLESVVEGQRIRIKELEADIDEITGVCQKCRSPIQWCDCKKEAKR